MDRLSALQHILLIKTSQLITVAAIIPCSRYACSRDDLVVESISDPQRAEISLVISSSETGGNKLLPLGQIIKVP